MSPTLREVKWYTSNKHTRAGFYIYLCGRMLHSITGEIITSGYLSMYLENQRQSAIGNRMVCSAGVRNITLHSSIYKGMYTSVNNSCLLLRIMEIKCNGNMSHSSLWLLFETLLCCYKHPLNYSQDMSINVHRCTWKTCYFCPYLTKTGVC